MSFSRLFMCTVLSCLTLSNLWGGDRLVPDRVHLGYFRNAEGELVNHEGFRVNQYGVLLNADGGVRRVDRENVMALDRVEKIGDGCITLWELTNPFFAENPTDKEVDLLINFLVQLKLQNQLNRNSFRRIIRNLMTEEIVEDINFLDDVMVAFCGPGAKRSYPSILTSAILEVFSIEGVTGKFSPYKVLIRLLSVIENLKNPKDRENALAALLKNMGEVVEDEGCIVCAVGKVERFLKALQGYDLGDGKRIIVDVNMQGDQVVAADPQVALVELKESLAKSVMTWVQGHLNSPYALLCGSADPEDINLGKDVMVAELDEFKRRWLEWAKVAYKGDRTPDFKTFKAGLNSGLSDYYTQANGLRSTVPGGATRDEFHQLLHGACCVRCARVSTEASSLPRGRAENPPPLNETLDLYRQAELDKAINTLLGVLEACQASNVFDYYSVVKIAQEVKLDLKDTRRSLATPTLQWYPEMQINSMLRNHFPSVDTLSQTATDNGVVHTSPTVFGGNAGYFFKGGEWVRF